MLFGHQHLRSIKGQSFYKLMGSGGRSGFSIWPDWGTYVLLQSWRSEEDFEHFKSNSEFFNSYGSRSKQQIFLKLKAFKSNGTWNKKEPFEVSESPFKSEHLAVLTRARIKGSLLHKFWRHVPKVSRKLFEFDGLVMAKGIGELPLIEQATISIWKSKEFMQSFAYKNPKHAEVVKKTRELDWYSEEIFARFHILEMSGTYKDINLSDLSN